MMQSILSCFACGDKTNNSVVQISYNSQQVSPENVQPSPIKVISLNESEIKTDDNKSRISMTTVTFLTSETTAPSKNQDDDQQIRRRIQILRKKDLPERKAMQSQFVRQNLIRSHTIYLIDKTWSEEYTKFLKSQKLSTMPPINNEKLMDAKGQLKLNVREKEDYFIVTQKIWKFVHGLYGGGPTIAKDSTFPVITIVTKKVTISPVPITNPLNLCFMISVMQMLMSIQPLNGYIIKKMYSESNESKKKLTHTVLHKFLKQCSQFQAPQPAQDSAQPSVQIKQFSSYFQSKFDPSQQHDAHEFLLHLAQLLQQEMKSDLPPLPAAKSGNTPESNYAAYFKQYRSIVDKIFAGQQQTVVNCNACENKSKTYVPILEIVLNIIDMRTLEECLENYFQSEKLQDLYDCENCKKKTKAIKSTNITKTPNYLVIVLGKFAISTLKKIEDRVEYGFDLNIKKYCYGHCGDTTYSLQSLIIHKGSKRNKGHYFTLSRRGSKNDWFYFNDGCVKPIEDKDVLGRDPYILVYERVRVNNA